MAQRQKVGDRLRRAVSSVRGGKQASKEARPSKAGGSKGSAAVAGTAAQAVPVEKPVRKKAGAGKVLAKKSPAQKVATGQTSTGKSPARKAPAAEKAPAAKAPAKQPAVKKAPVKAKTKTPVKNASAKASAPAARRQAVPRTPTKEYAGIRRSLLQRASELRAEHEHAMADLNDLQRDRVGDMAGDDQADTGTKTFEREQEISLAKGILDRLAQAEHALDRLDAGTYGRCERCGNPISKARLEAFPSVTLCVTCKQHEERR